MKRAENVFHYLILLGGNLGDVPQTLAKAVEHLGMLGCVGRLSSVYCSEAWGFEAENVFYNQVVELSTSLTPFDVLKQTQEIERLMGRMEKSSGGVYHSRLIDIDILMCHDVRLADGEMSDIVINSERLTVPHKLMHKRRFTLVPLAEMCREMIHPVLGKSVADLLEECEDEGKVWKM